MAEWDEFWAESSAEATYVGASGTHSLFTEHWERCFAGLPQLSASSRCIDIASGSGIVIKCAQQYFAENMPLYSALDISENAIDQINVQFPDVTTIVADAASIPLDSHSFELVTSQFGVEYAGVAGIREAARLVAAGGDLSLVLHCQPGVIFDECSTSVQVIDRLRQARFFPLAEAMLKTGFAAARGGDYGVYKRSARKFRPTFRVLEKALEKHGSGVASGFVRRVHDDLQKINSNLQNYDRKEVLGWLRGLGDESLSYRARMKSMTAAALKSGALEQIERELSTSGFVISASAPLHNRTGGEQLAWLLQAHRNSTGASAT